MCPRIWDSLATIGRLYSGRLALDDDVSLSIDEMRVKKVISWLMLFTSRFTAPDITWVLDKLIFVSYFFIVEVFFCEGFRIENITAVLSFEPMFFLYFPIRFSFSYYLISINIRMFIRYRIGHNKYWREPVLFVFYCFYTKIIWYILNFCSTRCMHYICFRTIPRL